MKKRIISAIVVAKGELEIVKARTVAKEDAAMFTKLLLKRIVEIVSS